MSRIVSGLVRKAPDVHAAVRELLSHGIPRDRIGLSLRGDTAEGALASPAWPAPRDDGFREGGTLVSVTAESEAQARSVIDILRRNGADALRQLGDGEEKAKTNVGTGDDTVGDASVPVLRDEIPPEDLRVPAAAGGQGVGSLLGGWDGKDRRTGGRNPWRGAERRMSA